MKTAVLILGTLLMAQGQAAETPVDPTGTFVCKSKFRFSSAALGAELFAKSPKTKRGPAQFSRYEEDGPTFPSRLDKRGTMEKEVDYYLARIGAKVHSTKPTTREEDYDLIFHAGYTHYHKDKSPNRELSIGIVQKDEKTPTHSVYHVIPDQGINGFVLKPKEGLLAVLKNPQIKYDEKSKKYKDEVLEEITLECTLNKKLAEE